MQAPTRIVLNRFQERMKSTEVGSRLNRPTQTHTSLASSLLLLVRSEDHSLSFRTYSQRLGKKTERLLVKQTVRN